jgi:hypothetical protein
MLGIDITLEQFDVTLESNIDLTTLSIDLLNLQTIHISTKEVPENSMPASTGSRQTFISTQKTKSGRGAFAIIDGSDSFWKVVRESVLSVKASLLAKKVQEDLYEYARGSVEERFFNQCSTPSDDHLFKDSYLKMKAYSKLYEKIDVYGKPAIVAHFPSVTVNLVHSVGVGSSAGSVTISITIIDLAKASFTKTIGATGRIIQERPILVINRAMSKDIKPFKVEDFLHQKLKSNTVPRMTTQNALERVSRHKINSSAEPLDSSFDSLSLLAGKTGKLNYDSDDSVSMDGFFEAIDAKRNRNVNESKDKYNDCGGMNDSSGLSILNSSSMSNSIDKRVTIMNNTSSFKHPNSVETHIERKTVSNQDKRKISHNSGTSKNIDLTPNSKSSHTKNSASVGVISGKKKTVKPDKEWDSAPMGRIDYSIKSVTKPLKSSENRKIQRNNSVKIRTVDKKLCPTSSTTTFLPNMPVDDIDKDLEKASNQIFNSFKCSVKVTNSTDIDKITLISSHNFESVPPVLS